MTDANGLAKLEDSLPEIPGLKVILVVGGLAGSRARIGKIELRSFWDAVTAASSRFEVRRTKTDEACVVLYTSGTTGFPKGVLHAHRVASGQAPSRQMTYNGFPQPGDCVWTPADWAWTGGLISCLIEGWLHGVRVESAERGGSFDPEWALDLMVDQGVTNGYLPPTALRMMMRCRRRRGLKLRSASCGGEKWNTKSLSEAREAMNGAVPVRRFRTDRGRFSIRMLPVRMGDAGGDGGQGLPGHDVRIMRADGSIAEEGEVGEAVLRLPDPAAMLGYLNNPEATMEKLSGGWLHTGDLARFDEGQISALRHAGQTK